MAKLRLAALAILAAGHDLLVAKGYGATTIAAVAEAAEVSGETVCKRFGSKPELVRQILDAAVVGDDEPVALMDRPAVRAALQARPGEQILAAFADASTEILARIRRGQRSPGRHHPAGATVGPRTTANRGPSGGNGGQLPLPAPRRFAWSELVE